MTHSLARLEGIIIVLPYTRMSTPSTRYSRRDEAVSVEGGQEKRNATL